VLRATAREEAGRGENWFTIPVLLADDRWSHAVLDFLSTTDVGGRVPAPAEEHAQSEASEWEHRERREKEEEGRREVEELGAEEEERPLLPPKRPPSWPVRKRSRESGAAFRFLYFAISFVISLVRSLSWDRPGRRANQSLQRAAFARAAAGNGHRAYTAMI